MKQTFRILHLEDNKSDAELIQRHLKREGFVCDVERVETESDFISQIERGCFDLILADYTLPSFNGQTALMIAMEKCPEVPIIFVSGTIREDAAVELIKSGATDYVLKDRLARLGPTVRRAIKEVEEKNERKRTEEALRASERQYRELVDNAIVGVYKSTREGKFIYVNDAMAQIFECDNTDEMLRLPVGIRYKKPEDRGAFLDILKEKGKVPYYEIEVSTKTGKLKTIVVSAVLSEGFITGMVDDISERKKAEEKLRQSESDLAEAQRVAGLGSWRFDIVTNTLRWSEELCLIFEVEQTEFGGVYESFISRVHPDDKPLLLEMNRRARESGEPFEVEYRIVTRAGRLKHIREIGYALKDAAGMVVGLFGTAQDITQRKQVEDRLHETHEKLQHLLAHTPAVIYSLKIDGEKPTPVFVSDNIQRLLGFSVSETLRYEWWLENLHSEDRDRVLSIVGEGLKGQGYSTEYRLWGKDGTYHWVEDNNSVVRDLNGRPIEAVGVLTDITERKNLEAQLRHSQKMEAVGQLAGGVAHDFNNILSAIIGYGALGEMKLPHDHPVRHYLQQILQSSERAAVLTQSLLAFSRKQPLRLELMGINEVIGKFEKFIIRLLPEDIELSIHTADEELTVFADRGQIEQVVMNLVTNARDAMPDKGRLSIATTHVVLGQDFVNLHGYGQTGDFAVISVTDSGVGMDEVTSQKIFEPFFTTKEVGKGTGLGLATVYGIIKSHDGFINVYSEPGKGTTFKVYLPVAHSAEGLKALPVQQPEELQRGSETILLAEDDADLLTMTSIVLREMGYTVIEAADGNEAVNRFIEYKDAIGLVILDGIMPGKNGKEVYNEVTALCPDTRCLFISGYSEDIFTKDGILQDEVAFLTKPIAPSVLLKKVREVLDR